MVGRIQRCLGLLLARKHWWKKGLAASLVCYLIVRLTAVSGFRDDRDWYLEFDSGSSEEKELGIQVSQPVGVRSQLLVDGVIQRRQRDLWNGGSDAGEDIGQFQNQLDTAVIVPYRERSRNWEIFLKFMVEYLAMGKNSGKSFHIVRVEQKDRKLFNRGKLSNVGIAWTLRNYHTECIAVHDVDLLPFPGVDYGGCSEIWHLPVIFSHLNWRTKYPDYFGGAVLMKASLWIKANGFSNGYWGWGKEDDDLWIRVRREEGIKSDVPPHQKVKEFFSIHAEEFGDKRAPRLETRFKRYEAFEADKEDRHRREGLNTLDAIVNWNRTYHYSSVEGEPPFLLVTEIEAFL